jgi:hypothetical protein
MAYSSTFSFGAASPVDLVSSCQLHIDLSMAMSLSVCLVSAMTSYLLELGATLRRASWVMTMLAARQGYGRKLPLRTPDPCVGMSDEGELTLVNLLVAVGNSHIE